MGKVEFLTANEILNIRRTGRIAWVRTKCKQVQVDGHKIYHITPLTIRTLKALNGTVN